MLSLDASSFYRNFPRRGRGAFAHRRLRVWHFARPHNMVASILINFSPFPNLGNPVHMKIPDFQGRPGEETSTQRTLPSLNPALRHPLQDMQADFPVSPDFQRSTRFGSQMRGRLSDT
jgi:hypothetical protein